MIVVREKLLVQQRLHGECVTPKLTDITVRDLGVIIDEPFERGGTNRGLAPTETLIAALVACSNVIAHKCADKHGVTLSRMTVDAVATLDRRGVTLTEEIEVPFPKVELTIRVTTDADEEGVRRVQEDLRRYCPVSKVLRNAGTEIHDVWEVTRP